MKATTFNTIAGENWFITNIYKAVSYMATLSAFIMACLRKTSDPISVTYVDRDFTDISSSGKIIVHDTEGTNEDLAALSQDAVKVVSFSGIKGENSRELIFGVGAITPITVFEAVGGALDGLNFVNEVEANFRTNDGVASAIRRLVSPRVATTSLREVLNEVFDLLPLIRGSCSSDNRLIVVVNQHEQTGEVAIWQFPDAELAELETHVVYSATVVAPDTVQAVAGAVKLFGE